MSSIAKSMMKKVRNNTLRFPASMYNNCYGSVAIVYCMCHGAYPTRVAALNKAWKQILKDPDSYFDFTPFSVSDEEFVEKTLQVFSKLAKDRTIEATSTVKQLICKVVSPYNVLFTVWNSEQKLPLPLREDGFEGVTLKSGKVVYPVFEQTES